MLDQSNIVEENWLASPPICTKVYSKSGHAVELTDTRADQDQDSSNYLDQLVFSAPIVNNPEEILVRLGHCCQHCQRLIYCFIVLSYVSCLVISDYIQ